MANAGSGNPRTRGRWTIKNGSRTLPQWKQNLRRADRCGAVSPPSPLLPHGRRTEPPARPQVSRPCRQMLPTPVSRWPRNDSAASATQLATDVCHSTQLQCHFRTVTTRLKSCGLQCLRMQQNGHCHIRTCTTSPKAKNWPAKGGGREGPQFAYRFRCWSCRPQPQYTPLTTAPALTSQLNAWPWPRWLSRAVARLRSLKTKSTTVSREKYRRFDSQ